MEAIDRLLQNLTFGNIAFNSPKAIRLGETAVIDLLLSLKVPVPELKAMVQAEGEKMGAQIRVSDRMEARLSGQDFSITAITPEVQAVSGSEITEWKWEVKPGSAGRHYLHLTLSALLNVDGASTPRVIRTVDQVIVVEVTMRQRVVNFLKENWQWLCATILIPLGGWLWKRNKKGGAGAA